MNPQTVLTVDAAKEYLDSSALFAPSQPSNKMAGYEAKDGKQLALALDNVKVTLYLGEGQYVDSIRNEVLDVVHYAAEKSRSSSIASQARKLGQGNAIIKLVVPTLPALIAVVDAYLSNSKKEVNTEHPTVTTPNQSDQPLNQIFYGPPGTGKTYATIDAAVEILSPTFFLAHRDDSAALKERFDSLVAAGHVRFVTFHQSFSYEDFVEGIRAETDEVDGQLRYEVVDGVFKSLCDVAAAKVTQQADAPVDLSGRRIWKMSLGAAVGEDSYIFDDCIENAYALLGYGLNIDFTGCTDREQILQRFLAKDATVKNDSYAVTAVSTFILKVKIGDLLLVTDGNTKFRAIGEVTGEYRYLDRLQQSDDYAQCRDVKWLRVYMPSLPHDQLMHNKYSQMTLYELRASAIDLGKLGALLKSTPASSPNAAMRAQLGLGEVKGTKYKIVKSTADIVELEKPNGNSLPFAVSMLSDLADFVRNGQISIEDIKEKRVFDKLPNTNLEPFIVNGYANVLPVLVEQLLRLQQLPPAPPLPSEPLDVVEAKVLIIDEINRGNVSRVFGELITLIEPSKRAGASEALQVTLPYSKDPFSVPSNLYIVGTMNTTDRSLAGLDIALRRRFDFREMSPKPELFDDVVIDGANVGTLLRVMNERIELLLDRDHCLGHAYFISLLEKPTLTELGGIFRNKILPLLQEYFFEDWQRIQWVLNDHRKLNVDRFVQQPTPDLAVLFGEGVNISDQSRHWKINDEAFLRSTAFLGIVEASNAVSR